jgi:hypothetical protein
MDLWHMEVYEEHVLKFLIEVYLNILIIQNLLKEIVSDYNFHFQRIKIEFFLLDSKYKLHKHTHKGNILKIKKTNRLLIDSIWELYTLTKIQHLIHCLK